MNNFCQMKKEEKKQIFIMDHATFDGDNPNTREANANK